MRHFQPSKRSDEIGDLSRALETLTQRLEKHIHFIESFAADLSHEFKNPLASIQSATDIALETTNRKEKTRFLKMIQRDVARLERLLCGVREITHMDVSLDKEECTQLNLNTLLTDLVEGFRLREKDITFQVDLISKPVTVYASPERLAQVFENILDNAVSFSPKGGRVSIFLKKLDSTAIISVSDQGPGIPKEHTDKIFERFFSYRLALKNNAHHTGLGLPIVRVIVEAYQGQIYVNNNSTQGACFEIRLPLCKK